VIAAEGQHGKRVAPHNADRADVRGGVSDPTIEPRNTPWFQEKA